tara:strand:- start:483 stop:725 length:243 start_codon:yes stop_codon:yes gene_type:complete
MYISKERLENMYGNEALKAIQRLIKLLVNDSFDSIHKMDGNADNYIELNDYLERNPTLEKDNSELYMLIMTAKRLLKYGK